MYTCETEMNHRPHNYKRAGTLSVELTIFKQISGL